MMKQIVFTIAVAALVAGCEQPATSGAQATDDKSAANAPANNTDKTATNAPSNNTDKAGAHAPADNTDKNERDRDMNTLTSGDQGGSEADRTVTQKIRQDVVKNDALSTTGKNVKIITVNGVVTLRGPVKSASEKSQIATIAQNTGGVKRVDNQLEVATN